MKKYSLFAPSLMDNIILIENVLKEYEISEIFLEEYSSFFDVVNSYCFTLKIKVNVLGAKISSLKAWKENVADSNVLIFPGISSKKLDFILKASLSNGNKIIYANDKEAGKILEEKWHNTMELYKDLKDKKDTIDFINVYSGASSWLGRAMSNWNMNEGEELILEEGTFKTVEGYWFYLSASPSFRERENFKTLSGKECKDLAKKITSHQFVVESTFRLKIENAILQKIEKWDQLYELLEKSTLPFVHYYVMNNAKIMGQGLWLMDFWEFVRSEIKK